jgi:hypothetical protein
MMSEYSLYRFPTVWNPLDHIIYADDPTQEPNYQYPLMDAKAWAEATGKKGIGSDSAGGAEQSDPLELTDIFFNNNNEKYNFADVANNYLTKLHEAKAEPDRRKARDMAAAVITSLDFTDFQNTVIIGENLEAQLVKTGVLAGLFQEIATPNLGGKWASLDSDVRWQRNIPEGKSPEPSGGTGAVTTITVPKHGGSVAITQRAQDVINQDNPFGRLTSLLAQKRLEDENEMVAAVIQANTTNTFAGVDFGARTGSPPASTTNPSDLVIQLQETFEALKAPWNLFVSKARAFAEFSYNDIVRGSQNPLPSVSTLNEQVGSFPLAAGVTWARDNKITSATAGWAMNDSAIKEFRGPTRTYTVANPDAETTKYVTKTHFQVQTMDPTLVYMITGITVP